MGESCLAGGAVLARRHSRRVHEQRILIDFWVDDPRPNRLPRSEGDSSAKAEPGRIISFPDRTATASSSVQTRLERSL
jgi:hypothetical protein